MDPPTLLAFLISFLIPLLFCVFQQPCKIDLLSFFSRGEAGLGGTWLRCMDSMTTLSHNCKLWKGLPVARSTWKMTPLSTCNGQTLTYILNVGWAATFPFDYSPSFRGIAFVRCSLALLLFLFFPSLAPCPSTAITSPALSTASLLPALRVLMDNSIVRGVCEAISGAQLAYAWFHAQASKWLWLNLILMNSNLSQLFAKYLKGASLGSFALAGLGYLALNSYYYVDVGHYAIKFNKLFGLSPQVYREGYNLKLPFIEQPIIYNVQTRENEIFAETANRDMQSIKLSVRVLFHPEVSKLDVIYTRLGKNYEQKVLPAICNEILRTVVAQFSANQLLSQRDQVSERIKHLLSERAAHFNIIIDNLAITDLTFGKEYLEAIEGKQVAQQEAERAKYEVEQAKEAKKSTIIKAEASAKSIELVGQASKNNPSYLDVRKIEYTEKIALILAESRNKLLLNNDILNMSLPKTTHVSYEEKK